MGVGTAMPALVADLGAVTLYAWPFVTFLAASVLATVVGGRLSDRSGPRAPILLGTLLFGVGLLVAGTAAAMPQLLLGRVLQGLGAGALAVATFVLIAAVYPERLRPPVFGLISSAWVLPSLLGPPVAGLVTETLSWHWVFLGLVPLVAVALALVAPAVRTLGPAAQRAGGPARHGGGRGGRRRRRGRAELGGPAPRRRRRGGRRGRGARARARRCGCCCPRACSARAAGSRRSSQSRGLLAGTFFTVTPTCR